MKNFGFASEFFQKYNSAGGQRLDKFAVNNYTIVMNDKY